MALLAIVIAAAASAFAHLSVPTNVPQAQAAFDHGLFLYYAYNGDEAVRDFTQAATLDPHLGMAYWGIALANGPDLNTPITQERFTAAADAVRKAAAMGAAATPLEQGLIAAMALRYKGIFADWASDDQAYRAAMLALAESSHDENTELLAAEALLEHGGLEWSNGSPADEDSRAAMQLVEGVLRDDPPSVMANHLCIHLYDLAPDRTPASPCAQRLDATTFPPEAEHLAHMPAHYWIEIGNYAAAERSSDRAYALMEDELQRGADSPHTQHYQKHDVAVGYSAAMMLANYADAQRWSGRMTAAFGQSFDALTALRFGRYDAAYDADANQFARQSVRGLAALQLGHSAEARTLAKGVAANPTQGYLPQFFLAAFAETQGNYDEALRWLEQAHLNQQTGLGGELIPWIPAGEALGNLALRRKDDAAAVSAFEATLQAYPNDPRALYGLSEALAAEGKTTEAATTRSRFQEMWKGADTSIDDALP
ncbi:MAG TPA: hypothetical protein VKR05_02865 [Candidatus Cybelea sp.]|nr:hypothetical protein [Candidatus Cybelea sp.]